MPPSALISRAVPLGLLLAAGCSPSQPAPGTVTPSTEQTLTELFNLPAVYARLGRIAAGGPMPFVGSVATFAGRGDSTIVRVGLSFENRAFAFQRDGRSYAARYRIDYNFQRPGVAPVAVSRDGVVRVSGFQETQRSDESVIVEQAVLLAPGAYTLALTVRDPNSNVFSRAEQAIEAPAFRAGSLAGPVLVYEARPRTSVTDSLSLLLNPRGTVANGGGDSLLVYVEGYRFSGPSRVPIEVRGDRDSVHLRTDVAFTGGKSVEGHLVKVASGAPPLGELTIALGTGPSARRVSALVSFSRDWVVTNYDNLLNLLRFFPYAPDLLGGLRSAKPEDRGRLWREFWVRTDPIPETPENEALDQYFTRIAIANERFRDEGGSGWRTDRGEVYVTLGEPDQVLETPPGNDRRIIQWYFTNYRAVLTFEGQMGFSRMRLTPPSRSEFARVRALVGREGPNR